QTECREGPMRLAPVWSLVAASILALPAAAVADARDYPTHAMSAAHSGRGSHGGGSHFHGRFQSRRSTIVILPPYYSSYYDAPPAPPPGYAAPSTPPALYRWTDDRGVTTWTDSLEKVPARFRASAARPPL